MAFTISLLLDSSITHLAVTAGFVFKGLGLHYRMATHSAAALLVYIISFQSDLVKLCNTAVFSCTVLFHVSGVKKK